MPGEPKDLNPRRVLDRHIGRIQGHIALVNKHLWLYIPDSDRVGAIAKGNHRSVWTDG